MNVSGGLTVGTTISTGDVNFKIYKLHCTMAAQTITYPSGVSSANIVLISGIVTAINGSRYPANLPTSGYSWYISAASSGIVISTISTNQIDGGATDIIIVTSS